MRWLRVEKDVCCHSLFEEEKSESFYRRSKVEIGLVISHQHPPGNHHHHRGGTNLRVIEGEGGRLLRGRTVCNGVDGGLKGE